MLNHLGQHVLDGVGGQVARVLGPAVADEHGPGAFGPGDAGRVHGLLDVGAVEVDLRSGGEVGDQRGKAEGVVEDGALLDGPVRVEAGVDLDHGVLRHVVDVAARVGRVVEVQWRLHAGRGELHVLLAVVGVAARLIHLFQLGHRAGVEVQVELVGLDPGVGGYLGLHCHVLADAGVVDEGAVQVEVSGVVLVDHGAGDVGHVAAGVRFAGDVDLHVLDAEHFFKVLEEAEELVGHVFFVGRGCGPDGEAGADRLFDPVHGLDGEEKLGRFVGEMYQSMLVRLTQEYGFSIGANCPHCQRKRPFSWKKPSREL